MATWTFITGELVTVEAETEERALELMSIGAYEVIETVTELRPAELPAIRKHGEHR
jgi:hypothetical protein